MIGVVVVTHGEIGAELIKAVKHVLPEIKHMRAVSVAANEAPESIRNHIEKALAEVKGKRGVLILTDMFGGTPSNICLSFLNHEAVEVISGVNLPMLIKLAHLQKEPNLTELSQFIRNYGQKNIVIASEVLES